MRASREGNASRWQCALWAALLVPTLACFSEDGVDLGEASSAQGSQTAAAGPKVSVQPSTLRISISAAGSQRQALKRPDEQYRRASHWLPPAEADWSELEISGPEAGENLSRGDLPGVISAGAARPTPSGTAAAGTDKLRDRAGQLRSLEHTYRAALLSLFTDSSSSSQLDSLARADIPLDDSGLLGEDLFSDSNPFEEALASNEAEKAAQPQEVVEEVPAAPAEPEIPKTPQPPASGGTRSFLEEIDEVPEDPFNFAVIGDLSQSGRESISRAIRDPQGRFVMENATRLTVSTGFFLFDDDDHLLTMDLNRDGIADLVLLRQDAGGSVVDVLEGTGELRFDKWAPLSLSQRIVGVSAFELSGDGQDDLVFIVEGVPHLVIYERAGSQFRYSRELVLPFVPGLLVGSQEAAGERRLYVFNSTLSELVALDAGRLGAIHSGPDSVLEQFKPLDVVGLLLPGQSGEFFSLELGGRITLIHKTSDSISFLGSFAAFEKTPYVIMGSYLHAGRQFVYVPAF